MAASVVGCLSGFGLLAAAVGVGRGTGWRRRWAVWLPAAFGISIIVGGLAFIGLLVSGID